MIFAGKTKIKRQSLMMACYSTKVVAGRRLGSDMTTGRSLPTVSQKLGIFGSTMTQGVQQTQPYQRRFQYGNYSNAAFQYPTKQSADLSMIVLKVSHVCLHAPAEKGSQGFTIDFLIGGVSAAVSKTAAAPIERKGSFLCGEETLLTSYVTSILRLLTFLSFKRLIHQRLEQGETETGGGGDGRHNRQKTAAIIHWRYHIYSKSWQCWNTRRKWKLGNTQD
ncbi:ADP,ATP carrier protein 1, mitochondrial [Tanacetum coccineum]